MSPFILPEEVNLQKVVHQCLGREAGLGMAAGFLSGVIKILQN